jgi:hypothetical protein
MLQEPMTYAELGEHWGISPSAARKRVDGLGLTRERGKDGKTRVMIDIDAVPQTKPLRPAGGEKASAGKGEAEALATALTAHVQSLRAEVERLTALAAANRADFERERRSSDHLATEVATLRGRLELAETELAQATLELVRAQAQAEAALAQIESHNALRLPPPGSERVGKTSSRAGFAALALGVAGTSLALMLTSALTSTATRTSSDELKKADVAALRPAWDRTSGLAGVPPTRAASGLLPGLPQLEIGVAGVGNHERRTLSSQANDIVVPLPPDVDTDMLGAGAVAPKVDMTRPNEVAAPDPATADVSVPLPPEPDVDLANLVVAEDSGSPDASSDLAEEVAPPSFTGLWAVNAKGCVPSPNRQGYLLTVISERGAWAGETACKFTKGARDGKVWTFAAVCSDPTKSWRSKVRLSVQGTRLTWRSQSGSRTYVRCDEPREMWAKQHERKQGSLALKMP